MNDGQGKLKINPPNLPDLDKLLEKIPISQIDIQNIHARIHHPNQYTLEAKNLYLKAFNQKSSVDIGIKEPDLVLKIKDIPEATHFLIDIKMMATKETISLRELKLAKETSHLKASGSLTYKKDPRNIQQMQITTHLESNFQDLHKWSLPFQEMGFY